MPGIDGLLAEGVWNAVVKAQPRRRQKVRAAEPSGPSVAMWMASGWAASSISATLRAGRQANSISR